MSVVFDEAMLIGQLEHQVTDQKVLDAKIFIGERKGIDSVRYEATACVIVPQVSGEAVMKAIVNKLKGTVVFHSSMVEMDDKRGADILLFTSELRYDEEPNDGFLE